jgi:hypothetical protein
MVSNTLNTAYELSPATSTEAETLNNKINALDFYLKHGYEIFGVLKDCPKRFSSLK